MLSILPVAKVGGNEYVYYGDPAPPKLKSLRFDDMLLSPNPKYAAGETLRRGKHSDRASVPAAAKCWPEVKPNPEE